MYPPRVRLRHPAVCRGPLKKCARLKWALNLVLIGAKASHALLGTQSSDGSHPAAGAF